MESLQFQLLPFLISATRRHCRLLYEGAKSDEVNIPHSYGSGVIPYLMAVSEGERQRGG